MPVVNAAILVRGDTIIERNDDGKVIREIPVTKVEFSRDSCRGVHVNHALCYETEGHVEIRARKA